MKTLTIAVALALALLATDAAMARGRRGCHGGNCYVGGVVQAPVQKLGAPVQKGLAKGEASPSDAAQAAEAAPAEAAPVVASEPSTQRTRRFASFRLRRRN